MQQAKHEVQQDKEKAKSEAAAAVAELQQNVSYLKRLVQVPACLFVVTEPQHRQSNEAQLGLHSPSLPCVAHLQFDKTRLMASLMSILDCQSEGAISSSLHLSRHALLQATADYLCPNEWAYCFLG